MSTQYKVLVGDTDTPEIRVPTTGDDSYLMPVTLDAATGNEVAVDIQYITNKATSGNDTGLLVNQTDTASPGTSLLADFQVGGTSIASLDNDGTLTVNKDGTYNSTDAALVCKNVTTPAKQLYMGFDNSADAGFLQSTHDGVATKPMFINAAGGTVVIGNTTSAAELTVRQGTSTAGIPVLSLEQTDVDDTMINFVGTSAADGSRSISSDTTEDSAKFGAIRIEINGVTKWIRVYNDHS